MSDRVALMFDGEIIQCGTPRQVYTCPVCRQAADYFGNCVYIRGKAEQGRFTAPGIACNAAVPEGEYSLLLRPEALDTDSAGDYRLTVGAVTFRGSDTQVAFQAEDGTVWKKAFSHAVPWSVGDTIFASLATENPILFPQQSAAAANSAK